MNHRQQFGEFVKNELRLWGLEEKGWGYGYENWKRTIGRCYYRDKTLVFSLPFIDNNPLDKMVDTVRHEIGHALAGPLAGHGPGWKALAEIVGYVPRHCSTMDLEIPCKYKAVCVCGHVARWHRKPRGTHYRCKCRRIFTPELVVE